MKYRVPLKLTFDGFAIVEATDKETAEEIACYHMGANLGHITDGASDKISDYEFDIHANVERRDDEDIEELYSIKELLKSHGFYINEISGGYELSKYTPAGEDWIITLDELEDIVEYAENFDPEEEFEFWVKADCKGKPSTSELWEDQLWKKEFLTEIADKIEE